MIISIGNLPPDISELQLRDLFDNSHCIDSIKLVREGNDDRLLGLLYMDIDAAFAEAIQHRFDGRWWHGRRLNVSLMFH